MVNYDCSLWSCSHTGGTALFDGDPVCGGTPQARGQLACRAGREQATGVQGGAEGGVEEEEEEGIMRRGV